LQALEDDDERTPSAHKPYRSRYPRGDRDRGGGDDLTPPSAV
jgi:hypothetical protein